MRVGVHIGRGYVCAATVVDDEVVQAVETRSDVDAAVTAALTRIAAMLGEPVTSVIVDVSDLLEPDDSTEVVAVLIEPRLPVTPRRHGWETEGLTVTTAQLRGGHTALGDELVALDEEAMLRLAGDLPRGARVVLSATGARCNPAHERRAAEMLRAAASVAGVTESHTFFSDSILTREYTAVVNAKLLRRAERLSRVLAAAVARGAGPDARVFVARNDGGCSSLARLSATPVHSLHSAFAARMRGAAAVVGRTAGRVVVALAEGVFLGEFADGMLPVVAKAAAPPGAPALASMFAQVVPLTDVLLSGGGAPATVAVRGSESALVAFGLTASITTDDDLVAIGAAMAPLSHWHNGITRIQVPADVPRALRDGASLAKATLVAVGADPELVRVTESRVLATAYDEAQIVRIRVRAVAETPTARPAARISA